ncbi:hypothetical protein LQ567_16955 [Niabella pedocola]|uniref:Uncharacterized protein n=1 Tax=Niabella pedocola TaxID=1752077 RepID=A0ABS8PW17_9BACT|nr:hypothetical protein [Niabella pedocola]MCD2424472.1 hypothetical protein [Niabella pedocola]
MLIHPRNKSLIEVLDSSGIGIEKGSKILMLLKQNGATQTEAIIAYHIKFGVPLDDVEKLVYPSSIWEKESLQEIAYQTFLYFNYNPDDSDSAVNENI